LFVSVFAFRFQRTVRIRIGSAPVGDYMSEALIDTGFVCGQEKGVTYAVYDLDYSVCTQSKSKIIDVYSVLRTEYTIDLLNRADQLIFALLLGGAPDHKL
jgi:hypothetical protein